LYVFGGGLSLLLLLVMDETYAAENSLIEHYVICY
jgi:hypothetical protein